MFRYGFVCLLPFVLIAVGSTLRADEVAYWSANGNAVDSTGGRNGTLVGATFNVGISGQAFSFDGGDDYVSVPDDDLWSFGSDPFSLATWVNFNTVKIDNTFQLPNTLISHDQGGGNLNKWVFFYDSTTNQLAFHINGTSAVFLHSQVFTPTVGTWHHFALTRSGDTYTFFADGNSIGTATNSLSIGNANASLTFGQAEGVGFLDGRLDELRIFNHELSSGEVSALASIPEPSAALLLGLAAMTMGFSTRRRQR